MQDHIIQKVFVEVTVNNKEKAFSLKEDINSFLSIDVFPEIEKYINTLEHQLAGHTLQIPRLELDLDVKSSSLNAELKENIARLFKEGLSEVINPVIGSDQTTESDSKAYLIDNQEKMVQTFVYFLEKGYMPWWNSDKKETSFMEPATFDHLILADNFSQSIIPLLSKANVQDRIINQFSNEQIAQLCLTVIKNKALKINLQVEIISLISKFNHTERLIIWRLVLDVLSKHLGSSTRNLREYLLQQITKVATVAAKGQSPAKVQSPTKNSSQKWKAVAKIFPFIQEDEIIESFENNTTDTPEGAKTSAEKIQKENISEHANPHLNDGQYVQNAGLILIHPFIKTFFEHCDLLHPETQQLTDPELGAHLLHYIATGKTNAPEHDMIFEKFLCYIPMNQSINRHIKLSRKHKTQAKNVIESVLHNWNPMRKSSPGLLQNEFFQRSGKLLVTDFDYTLTIERKAQDILLDKLSWGIGLFKLPWQEKFIFVNW